MNLWTSAFLHLNVTHTQSHGHLWKEFHPTFASQLSKTIPIIAQHGAVNAAGEMDPGVRTTAAQPPDNIQREFSFYFPLD